MAGDALQFELFGKVQHFKRLYFDETMMLKLNSFAREVSLQQDCGWEATPFIRYTMTKLTTDLFAHNECANEEAKARGRFSLRCTGSSASSLTMIALILLHSRAASCTTLQQMPKTPRWDSKFRRTSETLARHKSSSKVGVDHFLSMYRDACPRTSLRRV